jgi:hypothetical protein
VGDDGNAAVGFGRYLDRFERRGGEWRIAFRQVLVDIARPGLDPGEFAAGRRDRRDPSYEPS